MSNGRFKKPLKVSIIASLIVVVIIVLPLHFTGLLSSLIRLPKIEQEAISLGAPRNLEEYRRFIGGSGQNVASDLGRFFPAKLPTLHSAEPRKADPGYAWPTAALKLYNSLQPNIQAFKHLEPGDYLVTSDLPLNNGHIEGGAESVYETLAIHLANQGRFQESIEFFEICTVINRWRWSDCPLGGEVSLGFHTHLLQDVDAILTKNPGNQHVRALGLKLLKDVPIFLDYRRGYLMAIGFNMAHSRDGVPKSISLDLHDPMGRALWARRFSIVESAHRSDVIRAFIAGYKVAMKNPPSSLAGELARKAVLQELKDCNQVTQPLLKNIGDTGFIPTNEYLSVISRIRGRFEKSE